MSLYSFSLWLRQYLIDVIEISAEIRNLTSLHISEEINSKKSQNECIYNYTKASMCFYWLCHPYTFSKLSHVVQPMHVLPGKKVRILSFSGKLFNTP